MGGLRWVAGLVCCFSKRKTVHHSLTCWQRREIKEAAENFTDGFATSELGYPSKLGSNTQNWQKLTVGVGSEHVRAPILTLIERGKEKELKDHYGKHRRKRGLFVNWNV